MINLSPRWMIFIGILLMVAGVVLPFLMLLKIIPSTFFLNFLAFTASMGGLMLGMSGIALYVRENRGPRK